jgi:tRNA-dihydrouridine synthase B
MSNPASDIGKESSSLGPRGLPLRYWVRDICIEPCVVLAPMEGVTNLTFRRLIRSIGGHGLTYTEFIASSGINSRSIKELELAEFDADEDPIAIQIFGKDPNVMAEAARIIEGTGASIIDINMGCPSKRVCTRSGGSALMREPKLAVEIVRAVRAAIKIPLTVKMRSGFDAGMRNAPELAHMCQEEGAEAITIHWRTREDRYQGERAVDKIRETKERIRIPVIGNGDITDIPSAVRMFEETGCDGVMVGRGAMKNPWGILQISQHLQGHEITEVTPGERKRVLIEFMLRYQEKYQKERPALGKFKQIAKHFCEGLPSSGPFRNRLLRAQTIEDTLLIIEEYFQVFQGETG